MEIVGQNVEMDERTFKKNHPTLIEILNFQKVYYKNEWTWKELYDKVKSDCKICSCGLNYRSIKCSLCSSSVCESCKIKCRHCNKIYCHKHEIYGCNNFGTNYYCLNVSCCSKK